MNAIVDMPGVYLASSTLGRFNILVGARFRNPDLLSIFIRNLRAIPGVSSTETFMLVELLKYRNAIPSPF